MWWFLIGFFVGAAIGAIGMGIIAGGRVKEPGKDDEFDGVGF